MSDEEIESIKLISDLRDIQERETWTDEAIAQTIGIDLHSLNELERGLSVPTEDELSALRLFMETQS